MSSGLPTGETGEAEATQSVPEARCNQVLEFPTLSHSVHVELSPMDYTAQYYDLVLVAIFATMAVGAGVEAFTSLAIPTAVTVAGLVAVLLIGHGLFVNGPVDEPADLADEVDALN